MKIVVGTTALMMSMARAALDCHSLMQEDTCLAASCAWCKSAAVKSSCYDAAEAALLPPAIFQCATPPANHGCHFYNTKESCIASKEGDEPCYWCRSAAVKSTCYNETEAKRLPPAVFQCDKKSIVYAHGLTDLAAFIEPTPVVHAEAHSTSVADSPEPVQGDRPVDSLVQALASEPANHGCHFYNTEDACLKSKEGGAPCYWCKSAAVASTCYNETEAKQLPPAIFQCDKGPSLWQLTAVPATELGFRTLFQQWKVAFDVIYDSVATETTRFQAFVANAQLVAAHNRQVWRSYSLALNVFADTTWAEFQADYLGATPQNCSATHRSTVTAVGDVPDAIDWRRVDAVSPVKNQGKCGSCWTFSTTGCLESHNLLTHGKRVLLSEQNLVDCAQAFDNHGCNGGLPSHAFEYIKYNGGLDTGAAYPYHAKDETCKYDPANIGVTVVDVVNITSRDETQLRTAVGTVGPVSIAFQVSNDFRFYKDGVYDSTECKSGEADVNHAVLAVGYNTTVDGAKYWIVKNSWSDKWGIEGYFHIAQGKNMCGLADCASYPIV
ncbi:cysteine protease family C01A [Achlya hypogyna]|nr:cysteine protease family C01A [Achlya hypogyna]